MRSARPKVKPPKNRIFLCTLLAFVVVGFVYFVIIHTRHDSDMVASAKNGHKSNMTSTDSTNSKMTQTRHASTSGKQMRKEVIASNPFQPLSPPLSTSLTQKSSQHLQSYAGHSAVASRVPWSQFADIPLNDSVSWLQRSSHQIPNSPLVPDYKPVMCSNDIVRNLARPQLSDSDFKWCKWATSPSGGGVVVGKSWGKLTKKQEHRRFDSSNCNAVSSTGRNPSCDDSWGDIHIKNWRNNKLAKFGCDSGSSKSQIHCYQNDNSDKICVIENAQIDFSKYKKYSRGAGMTPSKKWQNNFLSADCKPDKQLAGSGDGKVAPPGFPFSHLYTPRVSSQQCDYTHNGTLLMFSHDDIRNLGHTLNDIFNVWIMMWMDGYARYSHQLNMLNIDSFKLGHNFDDQPNTFFLPYTKNLRSIMKGLDFGGKTLCVQRLLVQPLPPRFFIWESWFVDLPCSFVGPSSLYQRWNMHVRNSYGLVKAHNDMKLNQQLQVLLVVRNEKKNLWGSSRTSRNFLNQQDIIDTLNSTIRSLAQQQRVKIDFLALDLGKLEFMQQMKLIGETSVMIGAHGAGMASSMHMSIGTENCCGLIEIYPKGEFTPILGHANMARKMGLHYARVDVSKQDSQATGATVPTNELSKSLIQILNNIRSKPTCVLPQVINDPYLESVL
mmetsp:Transcript_6302/g.10503  ORF Transcript_6302/g.10503 Transcript_6302/m.10503 type:complete len:664 (+) Transcript_6302:51-2042(+)